MNRQYLTPELIVHILKMSTNPIWKLGILAASKTEWYSIIAVSKIDIIHFYGNNDTGWEHIQNRHAFYSESVYFGRGAMGNPSKFTPKSIPIYDFVNVADDIFNNGSIDEKEHPDSLLFVKYNGKSNRYTGSTGLFKDFILIMYRGTKIVHSLYPKNSLEYKQPKRILYNFSIHKPSIKARRNFFSDQLTVIVPYVDSNLVERYAINLQIDFNTKIGTAYLQVNHKNGKPYFSTPKLNEFEILLTLDDVNQSTTALMLFMNNISDLDFSHIERIILMIDKEYNPELY